MMRLKVFLQKRQHGEQIFDLLFHVIEKRHVPLCPLNDKLARYVVLLQDFFQILDRLDWTAIIVGARNDQ